MAQVCGLDCHLGGLKVEAFFMSGWRSLASTKFPEEYVYKIVGEMVSPM